MASDSVEEGLEHTLAPCYQGCVLAGLGLLNGIVTDCLLRRDRGYDEGGVKPGQV